MNYLTSTLMDNEKVIFNTKPHWIIFSPVMVWILASIVSYIYGPRFGLTDTILLNYPTYILATWISLVIAIYYVISSYITYISSEYAITDKRTLMKVGLIRRHSLEIFLGKIESIKVNQGIIGRMLDFGSIIICGTGGSKDLFSYIPDPLGFRKKVQEEIERNEELMNTRSNFKNSV